MIVSEIIYVDKITDIEAFDPIRWAVVEVFGDKYKVLVTYKV